MYRVYIKDMLLPIAPSEITVTNKNKNITLSLVDDSELTIIKNRGLSSYSFTAILPRRKYHFALYEDVSFVDAMYYITALENIKSAKEVVDFTVLTGVNSDEFSNKKVTLEEISWKFSSAENGDIVLKLSLKDYVHYQTKLIEQASTGVVRPPVTQTKESYTIKSGDTLSIIAKRIYGDVNKWTDIYNANKILLDSVALKNGYPRESGHWWIFPGTVIVLV